MRASYATSDLHLHADPAGLVRVTVHDGRAFLKIGSDFTVYVGTGDELACLDRIAALGRAINEQAEQAIELLLAEQEEAS